MLEQILRTQIQIENATPDEIEWLVKHEEICSQALSEFMSGDITWDEYLQLLELAQTNIDEYFQVVEQNLHNIGIT